MTFNSLEYLLFFPLVVAIYFAMPHRRRWALLLGASYLFYAYWRVDYLALLLGSTVADYVAGRKMGSLETKAERKPWLWLSIGVNLGLLATFKYLGFLNDVARDGFALVGVDYGVPEFSLLLPVGISFYTFQTLSYSIDVYRGHVEPERHLGRFALYVSFFPQLVAGPIERSRRLLPQFRERFSFDAARAETGLRLILWGLFMKVVMADRIGAYVNVVYADIDAYSGLPVWLTVLGFLYQIYGDFAGYSLIAIGSAQVMGFRLMTNFRQPLTAPSISDFWRRWHISLTTWFRDYLYAPLGGKKKGTARYVVNVLIVFTVTGLWHGAAWGFIFWGAINGLYLVVGGLTVRRRSALWKRLLGPPREAGAPVAAGLVLPAATRPVVGRVVVHVLMGVSCVFFRAESFPDVWTTFAHLAPQPGTVQKLAFGPFGTLDILAMVTAIVALYAMDMLEERVQLISTFSTRLRSVRFVAYVALAAIIVLFGAFDVQEFIYFQF
jgi:D-alanyl-lipoteichoic acid acyltransferase DltB (MBOAT superfamily)